MNRFIIKINPNYKNILSKYGNIIFDSQLINGLMGLETELSIEEVKLIPHVYKVEKDGIGTLYQRL